MGKYIKAIAGALVVLAVVYLGLMKLVLPSYLATAVPAIESMATQYINGQVQIGSMTISPGLGLTAGDISVVNIRGEKILTVPSVDISINPFMAVGKEGAIGAISAIKINNPVVNLTMDKSDKWNISGILKTTEEKSNPFRGKVYVNNGHLLVETPYGVWEGGIQGHVDAAKEPEYAVDVELILENENLSLTGYVNTDLEGRLNVKTDRLKLDSFAKLLEHYLPVENLKGSLQDVDMSWKNTGTVSMSGGASFAKTSGILVTRGYRVPLALDGDLNFKGMVLQAKKLKVLVHKEVCLVQGGLDLTDTANPRAEELSLDFHNFALKAAEDSLPVEGMLRGSIIVNGTKDDFTVDGTLTSPALTYKGITFTDVTLPLASSQGKLLVQNATADFGHGKLALTGEYGLQTKAVALGVDAHQVELDDLLDTSYGTVKVNGSMLLAGSLGEDSLRLSSVGDFMSCTWQNTQLQNLAVDVELSGDNFKLNNFSGSTAQGGLVLGQGALENGKLEGQISLVNLPIDDALPLVGSTGKGLLSGNYKLSGSVARLNVEGGFSLAQAEIKGIPLQEAHGFAKWQNGVLSLKRVEVNMEQGRHTLDGTVDLSGGEAVVDLAIATERVRIEPYWQQLDQSWPVTGNLSNKVSIKGPLSQLVVNGSVHAWDGSVNKFLVDDVAGNYVYEKGKFTFNNFVVRTLTTDIKLDGTLLPSGKLDIGIDAKNVHLARIPGLHNYAEVEGLADFSGAVSGTYKDPVFDGALTSDKVLINGEGFTGLACYLESREGRVNNLNGTFQQAAGGDYAIDLLVDFNTHLVQGDVLVDKGNVKSLLNIAKEDLDVTGLLTGKIELNKMGIGTGLAVKGQVDNAVVRGIEFKSADFDIHAVKGFWKINSLRMEEKGGGLFLAQGEIHTAKEVRTVDLEIGTSGANAKLLTVAMDHPVELEGKMDVALQLKGNLDNPEGNLSLQVSPGSISGVGFDNLYGMVTLRNDMLKLEQVLVQKGEYKISAYGTFPQDLLRREEDRRHPDARMDLSLKLDNANLAILPSFSPVVESADGNLAGGLRVTGTLENYFVDGDVKLESGTVKFKKVKTTLDNIKLAVNFAGKQVNLRELTATTGKRGTVEAHGNFALSQAQGAPYLLDFAAKDVHMESPVFTGVINAQGEVVQKKNRPHITAHVKLDDVLVNMASVPDLGEGQSNLGLNVTLELGPKIHFHNSFLYNLWVAGGLHVQGSTRHPKLDGSIYATRGTISYLNTPFNIDHAELTWPQRTFIPHINFQADTRFRNYNIAVKANGPLDMEILNISLTSEPAGSKNELVRMLTLKTENTGDNDMQGLLDAGLQMAFLSDVEDYIKRALTLDDFRVYSGNTRSSLGFDLDSLKANSATGDEKKQYNLLISKNISKHIMVGYTTSFDQEYHSVFAEYNISRHLSLNFSQNEKTENWFGIQYQLAF